MPAVEFGARLSDIELDVSARVAVARYDLVAAPGESLGCGGEVRISFDVLDTIDRALGGTRPLTAAQRVDLVGKLVRPLVVARFSRTEIPPPPAAPAAELEPEEPSPPTLPEGPPKDAFVSAHGVHVPAGEFVPTIKGE